MAPWLSSPPSPKEVPSAVWPWPGQQSTGWSLRPNAGTASGADAGGSPPWASVPYASSLLGKGSPGPTEAAAEVKDSSCLC